MDKKKLLLISILLYFFSIYSYAQENNTVISKTNGIIVRTNYCHTGLNTDLSFLRSIGKHSVEAGIKYHINTPIYDNRFHAFKHRFRTNSFIEHFGLTAGYTYNFKLRYSSITPYIFYNFQISKIGIRSQVKRYIDCNTDNIEELYQTIIVYADPMLEIENNIGFGFKTQIYKKIYFTQKAGLGIARFFNDQRIFVGSEKWDPDSLLSIGLLYIL